MRRAQTERILVGPSALGKNAHVIRGVAQSG